MTVHRFAALLWGVICVGIWAWLARDLVTVAICMIATIPYSVLVARDWFKSTRPIS